MLRQFYASSVASGTLAPRTGAHEIGRLVTELDDVLPTVEFVGDGLGVARLLGVYYSHDDVPDGDDRAHGEIDAELMAEFQRLAREGGT